MTTIEDYVFDKPHKILEQDINGEKVYAVKLLEDPYDGIIFSYGRVEFSENDEKTEGRMHFDYNIHQDNDKDFAIADFEHYIGELLEDIIRFELARNNLVFTGGTDEDRTNHTLKSDSQ